MFERAPFPGVAAPWELDEDERAAYLGLPAPSVVVAGDWEGIPAKTRVNLISDLVSDPQNANDAIHYYDVQRCLDVDPAAIVPSGVAFELVRFVTPTASILTIEDVVTMFEGVQALDAGGVPIFSFNNVNGENLCRSAIVHPTPAIGELTWRWDLTYTDRAALGQAVGPYATGVDPSQISGSRLGPSWTDARYGPNSSLAGKNRQFSAPASVVAHLWITLFGPVNRFSLRVGARMAGFWQAGGYDGRALDSATTRRV